MISLSRSRNPPKSVATFLLRANEPSRQVQRADGNQRNACMLARQQPTSEITSVIWPGVATAGRI